MRCLQCWCDISEKHAVFTKSCNHVFCQECGDKAFKKELSCPLCDTVLPKDGVGTIILKPDEADVKRVSTKVFGFEPHQMCEVLQMGLEFWAKQRQNESLKKSRDIRLWKTRVEESEEHVRKLSKALDEERMKKQSIIEEKVYLEGLVSELETRYADKARSMRKLSELYNELRQVHKRLEIDLQGIRDPDHRDSDVLKESEIEVRTVKTPGNKLIEKENRVPRVQRDIVTEMLSENKSHVEADARMVVRNPRSSGRSKPPPLSRQESSELPREPLFQLAQCPSRSSLGAASRENAVIHDRRRDRRHNRNTTEEYEAARRLTRRPSGHDRS